VSRDKYKRRLSREKAPVTHGGVIEETHENIQREDLDKVNVKMEAHEDLQKEDLNKVNVKEETLADIPKEDLPKADVKVASNGMEAVVKAKARGKTHKADGVATVSKKRKWKIPVGLGVLVAAAILIFMVIEGNKGLEVDILEIKPGTIASTFTEEGRVLPNAEQLIYVNYGGEVQEVAVYEGQEVSAGDLLVVLSFPELDSQLQQARAQLRNLQAQGTVSQQSPSPASEVQIRAQELRVEQAQIDLAIHRASFETMERLYQEGAVAARNFESARDTMMRAQEYLELQRQALTLLREDARPVSVVIQPNAGRIGELQAQINRLERQREQTNVTAPMDGVVRGLSIQEGGTVSPDAPLMNIVDAGSYIIEVYILDHVLDADIVNINVGMSVDLVINSEGEVITYEGTVKEIASSATEWISPLGMEEQRVRVSIELDDLSYARIFPGLDLDVEFTIYRRDNVLVIPRTALFSYNQGDAVWIVRDGIAVIQPVETGFTNGREIVITEGLNEGDLMILQPQLDGLSEGAKILI